MLNDYARFKAQNGMEGILPLNDQVLCFTMADVRKPLCRVNVYAIMLKNKLHKMAAIRTYLTNGIQSKVDFNKYSAKNIKIKNYSIFPNLANMLWYLNIGNRIFNSELQAGLSK